MLCLEGRVNGPTSDRAEIRTTNFQMQSAQILPIEQKDLEGTQE